MYFCVVLCIVCFVLGIVCFVSFSVLFVCICLLNYCHRLATQLQLNISYHKKMDCINDRIFDKDFQPIRAAGQDLQVQLC